MTTLPPALAECVEAIGATLARIERTLDESKRDGDAFRIKMAELDQRLKDVRKR